MIKMVRIRESQWKRPREVRCEEREKGRRGIDEM